MDLPAYDKSSLQMRLSPNVRRAWNHCVPAMKMKPRIIFDYELLYLERGELQVRIEDNEHVLRPGDIVLFKPGIEHEFQSSSGECWMPHIHFDALYYDDFHEVPVNFKSMSECSEREKGWIRPDVLGQELGIPDVIRIQHHGEVRENLVRLIYAYDRRDPEFPILQKFVTLRILYVILKGLEQDGDSRKFLHGQALDHAVTHIMEHYNEAIRLEDLSKIACLSVYHFSRLFKQRFGVSPHQYQMRHRIAKAKELMVCSRLSLTAVAEQIGYSSLFAFSKAFKQSEGMSPKQFLTEFSEV